MKKVLIIGCGFAGLAAIRFLRRFKIELELEVIDRKDSFDFLPLLPDAIGRNIRTDFLAYSLCQLSKNYGFAFVQEEVKAVDLENKQVSTDSHNIKYDYLLIACGSETNFYGNETMRRFAYKVSDVRDLRSILGVLTKNKSDGYMISGGGYTGIEVATNLRVYLGKNSQNKKVTIIEKAPSILGPLPDWMRDYVYKNLRDLDIEILTNTVIEDIKEDALILSGHRVFNKAMLIWVSGVKTPGFIDKLKIEKTPQGRIKVDDYLRINNSCFVVGDAANFLYKGLALRMAVQFSITQAICASRNILNIIRRRPLKKYKPLDLGYVIPMANNKSCGIILGLKIKGLLATVLHYFMCIYRSYGLRNKGEVIRTMLKEVLGW